MDEAGDERLAQPSGDQRESIRRLVRKRLKAAKAGDFVEYAGREGLLRLADGVKARGRKRLAQARAGSGA